MQNASTVSKEELQHRIQKLAEESDLYVSSEILKNAVGFIEFLMRAGFDCPMKVEPLLESGKEIDGDGGLKIKLKNGYSKAELDLRPESSKSTLRVFHENTNSVLEMKGTFTVK